MEQTESDQIGAGRGITVERRGGTSQRACMNDQQTRTAVWGSAVGVGVGWVDEGKGQKLGQL